MDANVTVVGNLTADPELRYTPTGAAVVNMTIASTPRIYDRQSGEWKDGESLFLRGILWREYAINAAASLTKGMRVIAIGKLKQRSYETREGDRRTLVELEIDEIGPTLRYATAKCSKTTGQREFSSDPWNESARKSDSSHEKGDPFDSGHFGNTDSGDGQDSGQSQNAEGGKSDKKILVGENVSYDDFDSDEVPF